MGVGVAVGLVVNAVIVPPLTVKTAVLKLSGFRLTLAKYLDVMATVLVEQWPPEQKDWAASTAGLATVGNDVRDAMHEAAESRRANLRAQQHKHDIHADHDDLEALENVSFHIRDISETLASAVWGAPFSITVPAELTEPLSRAMHAAAELLRAWDAGSDEEPKRTEAEEALDVLFERIREHQVGHRDLVTGAASIAFDVHRIVYRIVPRLADPD